MIPKKNYIKLILIYIVVITICILLKNSYNSYKELKLKEPVLRGVINEIKANEIESYLTDNRDALLYIGSATDSNSREVETNLKDLLKEKKLTEMVIYLNVSDVENIEEFYNNFNENYSVDVTLTSYPAFVIIHDGIIRDLVQKKATQKLQSSYIDALLEEYEIIGEQ